MDDNFPYTGTRPHWTDKNQIWHEGSRYRCNHTIRMCHVKWVKGFPSCEGSKCGSSIDFAVLLYLVLVLACKVLVLASLVLILLLLLVTKYLLPRRKFCYVVETLHGCRCSNYPAKTKKIRNALQQINIWRWTMTMMTAWPSSPTSPQGS